MKTKTKIINLHGGPGVGKSTVATGVFSNLKQKGLSCELASEYAKEITWEETFVLLENQIHLFAEQFRRQFRLLDKVDYVIVDSPLLLNSIYFDYYNEKTDNQRFTKEYIELAKHFFDETFAEFNNVNFYITRNTKYDASGRNQELSEALKIDKEIKKSLSIYDPSHYTCIGTTTDVISEITKVLVGNVHIQGDSSKSN